MSQPFASDVAAADEAVFTERAAVALAESILDVRGMSVWDRISLPPFVITAVQSVDALGDLQVNCAIEAGGQRIFHGGNTLFHGYWWLMRSAGPSTWPCCRSMGRRWTCRTSNPQPATGGDDT